MIKLYIVSKKINPKHLNEKGIEKIKVTYYLFKYYFHLDAKEYSECT